MVGAGGAAGGGGGAVHRGAGGDGGRGAGSGARRRGTALLSRPGERGRLRRAVLRGPAPGARRDRDMARCPPSLAGGPEVRGLLAAVKASPRDDAPRRILADW